ncbi:MAG: CPBP family intramembrane glutamic endopeptidase [Phycisphaerales bacterium]|nr:CPBP family intramembrane metalloprotease [Planctomycetota bacterium]
MLELGLHLAIYAALFGLFALVTGKPTLRALALGAAIYAAQALALRYAHYLPTPAFLQASSWNWIGKAVSIVAVLALFPLLTTDERRETGLTIRFKKGWAIRALPVVFLLVLLPIYFARNAKPEPWNTEAIAFQATMPGFAEELAYRGLMLAVLNVAFLRPWKLPGAKFGPALIITSLMFGVSHGVTLDDAGFSVNTFNLVRTTLSGFLYGYIMEACGTLIAPIFAHNLSNAARYLFVMLK